MKSKTRKKRAQVFCVPGDESSSGKHEVIYARDGDLNAAARRGNIRRFSSWNQAEGFAHTKGKELEAEVMIHSYMENPTYITRYKKTPKQKLPLSKKERGLTRRKPIRITPKRPKLGR